MTTELDEKDVYLNLKEEANLLMISRTTIHRLIREKKLTPYGITRHNLFRRSEVIALRDTPKTERS